jgi:alpha-ketoglutarate-dependent taurine dioxygenase
MLYNYTFPKIQLPRLTLKDDYKSFLKENGVLLIDLKDKPLSNAEYIEFMSQLGTPLAEKDAKIGEFIEDKYVLNLLTKFDKNADVNDQPFSTTGLTFHMEKSFSPLTEQPNYLALMSIIPPNEDNGGQTIFYKMSDFKQYFSQEELDLMKTIYPTSEKLNIVSANALYTYDPKREMEYFSLRDLGEYEKDWTAKGLDSTQALKDLAKKIKECLYKYEHIFAFDWQPNYLYVFDNKMVFHARTEQKNISSRHLKRVRVV